MLTIIRSCTLILLVIKIQAEVMEVLPAQVMEVRRNNIVDNSIVNRPVKAMDPRILSLVMEAENKRLAMDVVRNKRLAMDAVRNNSAKIKVMEAESRDELVEAVKSTPVTAKGDNNMAADKRLAMDVVRNSKERIKVMEVENREEGPGMAKSTPAMAKKGSKRSMVVDKKRSMNVISMVKAMHAERNSQHMEAAVYSRRSWMSHLATTLVKVMVAETKNIPAGVLSMGPVDAMNMAVAVMNMEVAETNMVDVEVIPEAITVKPAMARVEDMANRK